MVGWVDGGEVIIVLKLLAGIELGNKPAVMSFAAQLEISFVLVH